MKKYLIASFCFLFNLSSMAQDLGLSGAQKKEYDRRKLTVDAIDVAKLKYHTAAAGDSTTESYLTSWKKWRGHRGLMPVTEEKFFRIAGYNKEADIIKKYKNDGKPLIAFGALITAAGIVMMVNGYEKTKTIGGFDEYGIPDFEYVHKNGNLALAGLISLCVGLGMAFTGLGKLHHDNWSTYGVAQWIADEYNAGLLLYIKKEF